MTSPSSETESFFHSLIQEPFPALADQPALSTARGTLTYAELERLVARTTRVLAALGVRPGDRVLLVFPNSPATLVATLAVITLGAVAVPAAEDTGVERLRYLIETVAPRACLHSGSIAVPPGAGITRVVTVDLDASAVHFSPECEEAEIELSPSEADRPGLILFSSGSTGRPKGVVLNQGSLLWTASMLARVFCFGAGHRELILARLSHSGAWQRAAATLGAGGCIVLGEDRLTISGLLEDLREFEIHGFYTPPPIVRYLLRSDAEQVRTGLAGCKTIEIGSAPLTGEELQELLDLVPTARVYVHYGLTECSRGVILDARAYPGKLDTVGRAAPGADVEIRDDAGKRLPAGGTGEILLRGPQLAAGYWQQPDRTRESFAGRWIRTGDYGSLDADGFLSFAGRRDDQICCAGYSFFPAEVETELGPVPGVDRYLIAGLPDPRGILGDLPCAFVVAADPGSWTSTEFFVRARHRLPSHMVPRRVILVPDLPVSLSGKTDRRRAVEMYGDRES